MSLCSIPGVDGSSTVPVWSRIPKHHFTYCMEKFCQGVCNTLYWTMYLGFPTSTLLNKLWLIQCTICFLVSKDSSLPRKHLILEFVITRSCKDTLLQYLGAGEDTSCYPWASCLPSDVSWGSWWLFNVIQLSPSLLVLQSSSLLFLWLMGNFPPILACRLVGHWQLISGYCYPLYMVPSL